MIYKLYGTNKDAHCIYMLFEFVQGGELFTLLRDNQTFPENVARFYAACVLVAIEHLHKLNIIYRDLKVRH